PEGTAGGVLLLDEPFSAVDAPMRQVLYRELAQLRASLKIPMVLVTHDLNEARRLAHRIVIIDGGASLQVASPSHIMSSPRNARVAHLVGIHNHFRGQFYPQTDGWAQLQWGLDSQAPRLIVRDKAKISAGSAVTWVLAAEAVRLLGDAEAAPEQANVLCATFTELLPLGEISLCRLHIQGTSDTMELNLATSQVVAMRWHSGSAVRVALAFDAVHIMPLR
ncbi:MAG: ABC transporter ATP-binding protein, partial [Brachymonas sp.]|nr:ABC transporter ATP-binding protein [Brachymonas sp.]